MENITSEKHVQYGGEEPQHLEAGRPMDKRGSIYQIVPPTERRMSAQGRRISVVDDIFGEIKEDGPNYRNVNCPNHRHRRDTDLLRSDGLGLPC